MPRATIVTLLVALAMLVTALPAVARSPIAMGIADPDQRGGSPDVARVEAAVEAHRAEVGRYPAMWSLWSKWGDGVSGPSEPCEPNVDGCAFPEAAVAWLHSKGITPVIWWLPMDPKDLNSDLYARYSRILKGRHDAYIEQWARDAKAAGLASQRPVLVRFAHEATGYWFPWSIGRKDNTTKNYKRAWTYLERTFKAVGARPHIRWVWAQYNMWESTKAYPGDYIDYLGLTVLNFGGRNWKPAGKLIDKKVNSALRIARKPVIVAEIGTNHEGGNKGDWIHDAYVRAYKKHPKVKGLLYLDTTHNERGVPDWTLRVGDAGAGLEAYRELASQPRFQGQIR